VLERNSISEVVAVKKRFFVSQIRLNISYTNSRILTNNKYKSFYFFLFSLQRPLLIIFDRGMDLTPPLHHTWTYQALSHDVLDLNLNQIKFTDESTSSTPGPSRQGPKSRSYDLDDRRDYFWSMHKGSPFPTTAEAIQAELEDYRKSEDEVKRLKATMVWNFLSKTDSRVFID